MSELILNNEKLKKLSEQYHDQYVSANPFPHIVIDDFLSQNILDKIIDEFPSPDEDLEWRKNYTKTDDGRVAQVGKLGFSDERQLGTTSVSGNSRGAKLLRRTQSSRHGAEEIKSLEMTRNSENLPVDMERGFSVLFLEFVAELSGRAQCRALRDAIGLPAPAHSPRLC